MAEQQIYGLHAVAAALRYEPEQVQELWIERQRRDGRISGAAGRRRGPRCASSAGGAGGTGSASAGALAIRCDRPVSDRAAGRMTRRMCRNY